jgi:uncharacterized protein YdeI (YjbR/CyaY-like superfamily)
MADPTDLPILSFQTADEWREWLEENHATSSGIWMRFFKKASGVEALAYPGALDEALCYGWIDGQVKPSGENSYLQRFTPRRPRSNWSRRNTEHVARLTAQGRMRPAGLAQVEKAKADGRWENAYSMPSQAEAPADFLEELGKDPDALAFYESLNKVNKYAVYYQLTSAKKPETRERRKQKILEMMARREKLY